LGLIFLVDRKKEIAKEMLLYQQAEEADAIKEEQT